jgi:NAD(P) transhydrogenase subunit alpha
MKIAIPKERRPDEARVAATPETVKKLIALGAEVAVEAGAGAGSSIPDEAYRAAGASVVADASACSETPTSCSRCKSPWAPAKAGPTRFPR